MENGREPFLIIQPEHLSNTLFPSDIFLAPHPSPLTPNPSHISHLTPEVSRKYSFVVRGRELGHLVIWSFWFVWLN